MDLLITGATGFLGSHLVVAWLLEHPDARVACLVRGANQDIAYKRLDASLRQAANDSGSEIIGSLGRVQVFSGDIDDPAWVARAGSWLNGPCELIHCAANLSFRETDRADIWRTNVDGTAHLLRALSYLPPLAAFNYISTAYVAGDRGGIILEGEEERPGGFNNPYEESKWVAEGLVRKECAAMGLPWRVLRPSIIIAHSVTHRMSSSSGFYQVITMLLDLGQRRGTAPHAPISLPVSRGTTIDLIPVDSVVADVSALIAAGAATQNTTFHVTGANTLGLVEVLGELSPMSGVSVLGTDPASAPTPKAKILMRQLHHYLPYLSVERRFDQTNLEAQLQRERFHMDLRTLRHFFRSYMQQLAAA